MKRVVVNDTNVFIDLFSVGLLKEFFSLPWEVHTTEFVLLELNREGQSETVRKYKEDGRLHIPTFEPKEMIEIASLLPSQRRKSGVSFTDCSVWYYAKKNGYTLLTGDRKLRLVSEKDEVEVHGIIYVIDSIKEAELLSANEMVSRLKLLMSNNPRLPKEAIEKRLKLWATEVKEKGGT